MTVETWIGPNGHPAYIEDGRTDRGTTSNRGSRQSSEAPQGSGALVGADSLALPERLKTPDLAAVWSGSGQPPISPFAARRENARPHVEPVNPSPLDLSLIFTGEWPQPDYVVHGLLARRDVAMLSGDAGAGKTWLGLALATTIANGGGEWLGHTTEGGRVLVIDEENPAPVVYGRLRALGLKESAARNVVYFNRNGLAVGELATNDWLDTVASEHEPDVVIIDTATAATAVADVNDNGEVVKLFKDVRTFAEDRGCLVLMLHHERKSQQGQSHDPGQKMLGARQWAGQADAHLAVRRIGPRVEPERHDDGRTDQRLGLGVTVPKLRNAAPPRDRTFDLVTQSEDGRLSTAHLEETEQPDTRQNDTADRIRAALDESGGPISRKDLARTLGINADNGTLKRALEHLLETREVEKPSRGFYALAGASERRDD